MKSTIHKLIPSFLVVRYRRFKRLFRRFIERETNRKRSTEKVFTDIYANNRWGGLRREFYSGGGSIDNKIVSSYISMISDEALSEGFHGLTFVDLGCGDFRVGRKLLPLCSRYIGVDIVEPLVSKNQEDFGSETTRFMHLNIIEDNLPDGDVCFIRQVLQHLSNQQISAVLSKIKKYKWVFITEHYPTDNDEIKPNKDKVHGRDIRVAQNSGVYLSEPPFSLPKHQISMVLEVSGSSFERKHDRGLIRTFLYKPVIDE